MASIRKRSNRWEVRVRRQGFATRTKSFSYKSDALAWARETELLMDTESLKCTPEDQTLALGEAIERYIRDIAVFNKGFEIEKYRLRALAERLGKTKSLASISPFDISQVKTERLRRVSSGTVRRELNLLSSLFETARNEWNYAALVNPVKKVKRPPDSEARQRRLSVIERHLIVTKSNEFSCGQLHLAILFALETAMRQGEILKLRWSNIDLDKRTISVTQTKNATSRLIVISSELQNVLSHQSAKDDRLFNISSSGLQQAFRRLCNGLRIYDLRFHDLRHESISTMFERGLSVPEVQLMSGHKTIDQLMRYSHAQIENIKIKIS